MEFKEIMENALYIIITTSLPIFLGYLIILIRVKKNELIQKIDNEFIKATIEDATDLIFDSVDKVSQTYVDQLKKDGVFDINKQKEALLLAITSAKDLMSEEMMVLLNDKYNDLDEWIIQKIEAYIKIKKS